MQTTPIALAHVALNTFALYVYLIVLLRLWGRRHMGQFTVFDLVIVIVLGSAVETAMINGQTSLAAGLVSAITLLLGNRLINAALRRSTRFRHIVEGVPVLLVRNGQFIEEHLKRAGLTQDDVLEALRERGAEDVAQVKYAVLESDGEISVVN